MAGAADILPLYGTGELKALDAFAALDPMPERDIAEPAANPVASPTANPIIGANLENSPDMRFKSV